MTWLLLADAVLAAHVALTLFVVLGLPVVIVGGLRGWPWIASPWLRLGHLATIAVVAAEAWLGLTCPLTTLENSLRRRGGDAPYAGGFVEHGLHAVLFWDAPAWVFTAAYTLFALAVLATWWRWPARWPTRHRRPAA